MIIPTHYLLHGHAKLIFIFIAFYLFVC